MKDASRVKRNTFSLYALTISNYFIGLMLFPYISRILSVQGFGVVGFGMAFALIFQSIVDYGFMISATAKVAKNRSCNSKVSEVITNTMMAKALLFCVALFLFFTLSFLIPMVKDNLIVMWLFFMGSVTNALVPDFYFRGMEKMRIIAIRGITTKSISIVLVLLVVKSEADLILIPLILFFGNLLAVLWTFLSMHNMGFRFSRFKIEEVNSYLRESFLFFISRVSATINLSLGAFALGISSQANDKELGIYAAASRLTGAGEMMLIPVSDSIYPHMIKNRDYKLFRTIYLRGLVIWLIGCLVTFVFANSICSFFFGPSYWEAGNVLRVLLFGSFMAFSANMFGYNALAPIGLARHANFSILVSLLISITFISILIIMNLATLMNIAVVMALSNFIICLYRVIVFYTNRGLINSKGS